MKNLTRMKRENFISALLLLAAIAVTLYLAWRNHNDFKNTVIADNKAQLLLLAKTQAQSLSAHAATLQGEERTIRSLVAQVDRQTKAYVLIIDDRGNIKVSPHASLIGKNIFAVSLAGGTREQRDTAHRIFRAMASGEEGTAVFTYMDENNPRKFVRTVIAFTPLRNGHARYSLAILKEFSSISGPLNKNAWDNLMFFVLVLCLLTVWGGYFLRSQKEKTGLETAATALKIVNRQLRCDIEMQRELEKKIHEGLRKRPRNP